MTHAPSLRGRSRELGVLVGLLDQAAGAAGAMAVVEGEAGIGKTTLVGAAIDHAVARGVPVYRCAARDMESHRPFGVVRDALGIHLDAAGHREREIAEVLDGNHTALESGAWAATQFWVEEAVLALLDELTRSGPVVVVAEDLHWADPASLAVLARLARATAEVPVVAIWTLRPLPRRAEVAAAVSALPPTAVRCRLGPLTEPDVHGLAEQLAGAALGPRLRRLLAGAGGNPLFVSEVIGVLLAEGALIRNAEGALDVSEGAALPSFAMAVLDHLSFLAPATVQLLGTASVLGSSFAVAALSQVTHQPVGALWPMLAEALAAQVLTEDGERLAFRHDLIHDAFYDDLPAAVRDGLHADAATALEAAGAGAAAVAEHVIRSARALGPDAVTRLRQAAAEAAASGAPGVAADLLQAALAAAGRDARLHAALNADLGLALVAAGRPAEGESVLREVLASGAADDREAAARAALQQALLVQGRLADALAAAESGAASPGLSVADRARFAARASMSRLFVGDVAGALAAAVAAEADAVAAGDIPAEVRAILTQAHVASLQARWHEAKDHAARSVALIDLDRSAETHESLPYHVQAQVLTAVEEFDAALAAAASARRAAETFGVADSLVMAHLVGANALFWSGRWDDALAAYETAVSLAEDTGTAWQVEALCTMTLIRCWQGDRPAASDLLARADAKVAAGHAQFRVGWRQWARSVLAEAQGDFAAAVDVLVPAWQMCAAAGIGAELRAFGPHLAGVAVAAGRTELAKEIAAALESQAAANPGLVGVQATALRVRGLATGDPDVLLEALTVHRSGPHIHGRARCAEAAASALARAGRLSAARSAGEEAVQLYSELGAEGELARARADLRSAGLRLGVRGRRRRPTSGWAALTDTEAHVARLVAQRLSNPEIAQAMFLSRRTVGHHVSHLLAKLGMSARTELAAAAARGPIEQLGEHAE